MDNKILVIPTYVLKMLDSVDITMEKINAELSDRGLDGVYLLLSKYISNANATDIITVSRTVNNMIFGTTETVCESVTKSNIFRSVKNHKYTDTVIHYNGNIIVSIGDDKYGNFINSNFSLLTSSIREDIIRVWVEVHGKEVHRKLEPPIMQGYIKSVLLRS